MRSSSDDSKDTSDTSHRIKSKLWEARNQQYIQNLIMRQQKALAQSKQAAEQEQRLRATLARRVLGASYDRFYPRQAGSPEPRGAGSTSEAEATAAAEGGADNALPGREGSVPAVQRANSESQIPKLPRLGDSMTDWPAPPSPAAHSPSVAPGVDSSQGATHTDHQYKHHSSLNGTNAGGASSHDSSNPARPALTSITPHQGKGQSLSRSVSAGPPGTRAPSSPYATSLRASTGFRRTARSQQDAAPHQAASHQAAPRRHQPGSLALARKLPPADRGRATARRSAFPEPSMQPVQEEKTDSDSDGSSVSSGGGGGGAKRSSGDGTGRSSSSSEDGSSSGDDNNDVHRRDRRSCGGARGGAAPASRGPRSGAGGGGGPPQHPSAGARHTTGAAPALATTARSGLRLSGSCGLPATASGYTLWRARARLPEGQRTFCISGTGNHSQGIRAGLLARGWYENPDRNSPFFDFKWAANPLDINHDALWPGQIVNHFRHSICLTTKHGLCHTLRDMVWYEAADWAAFYPRGYDISDEESRRDFLQDVRMTAAESLIKRAVLDGAVCSTHVPYNPGAAVGARKVAAATIATACSGSSPVPHDAAAAGAGGSGAAQGAGADSDNGNHRLAQRSDLGPLVDLPSLQLACRVVAARLRQQRYLRVVHETTTTAASAGGGGGGGGGGGPGGTEPPPPDVELTPAQWQQLVRHRALFCSAPVMPPPEFDPNWISSRTFITSAMLPQQPAANRGKASSIGGGGGVGRDTARRGPSRKDAASAPPTARASSGPLRQRARRQPRRGRSDTSGDAGTGTDGERGLGTRSSGVDSSGGSDSEDGGDDPASGASDAEGQASGLGAKPGPRGPVVVADAADLLRQEYSGAKCQRRQGPGGGRAERSRPAAGMDDAGTGGESTQAEAAGAEEGSASDADRGTRGASSLGEGEEADAGDGASWLPEDLPAICYDDQALQVLDHSSWRAAAAAILSALESSAVQTHISGTNNIWIVKPAGKSRGRGIRLFNDPDALLAYTRGEEAQGLEARWIAQKYVERPLIIARRKFDIRQWVLVTDWNPLQAWFYATCYLRFAADDYDPNNLDVFQHLTNNSVSKYYEGPKKEDEITAAGNMWSIPRFQEWLAEVYGRDDIWEVLLQPAMRHIAICTLKSAQDHIVPRKGSCQLYGYDFLIDDQLRVWLLEVNSSPTLEPSTPITAQLCADVQEDILKVVVDLPAKQQPPPQQQQGGPGGDPADPADTGKWELIVDGGEELRQPQYTGLSLELKGTALHLPSTSSAPRPNPASSRLHGTTRQSQQHAQNGQHQHQQHKHHPHPQQQQQPHDPHTQHRDNGLAQSSSIHPHSGSASDTRTATEAAALGVGGGVATPLLERRSSRDSTGVLSLPLAGPHTPVPGPAGLSLAPLPRLHTPSSLTLLPDVLSTGTPHGPGRYTPAGRNGPTDGPLPPASPSGTLPLPHTAGYGLSSSGGGVSPQPSSRGTARVSPPRLRTPRLSAPLPAASSLSWDASLEPRTPGAAADSSTGMMSDGSPATGGRGTSTGSTGTGDLIAVGSSAGGGGGGRGGGSPLLPVSSPRNATPRGHPVHIVPLVYNAAAGSASWEPLGPMTMQMSLLARPGHQAGPLVGSTVLRAR